MFPPALYPKACTARACATGASRLIRAQEWAQPFLTSPALRGEWRKMATSATSLSPAALTAPACVHNQGDPCMLIHVGCQLGMINVLPCTVTMWREASSCATNCEATTLQPSAQSLRRFREQELRRLGWRLVGRRLHMQIIGGAPTDARGSHSDKLPICVHDVKGWSCCAPARGDVADNVATQAHRVGPDQELVRGRSCAVVVPPS